MRLTEGVTCFILCNYVYEKKEERGQQPAFGTSGPSGYWRAEIKAEMSIQRSNKLSTEKERGVSICSKICFAISEPVLVTVAAQLWKTEPLTLG